MALIRNPLGLLGILPDAVAAEQEGGLRVALLQAVQQLPGVPPGGAVVKGQRHIFFFIRPLHRRRQKTQAQQQAENSPQPEHFLSI